MTHNRQKDLRRYILFLTSLKIKVSTFYFISDDPRERLAPLGAGRRAAVPRSHTTPPDPPTRRLRAAPAPRAGPPRSAPRSAPGIPTATYLIQSVEKVNIIVYFKFNFITICLMLNQHPCADGSGSTGAAAVRHGWTVTAGQSGTPGRAIAAQTSRGPRRVLPHPPCVLSIDLTNGNRPVCRLRAPATGQPRPAQAHRDF